MPRLYLSLIVVALAYPAGILLFAEQWAFGGAMLVGTFTVGVTVLVGVPSVAWCVRRGWFAPWHAALGGSVAGLLCSILFLSGGISEMVGAAGSFVAVGAVHGLAFWVLALWGNTRIRHLEHGAKSVA
jgi:hypothetical protein